MYYKLIVIYYGRQLTILEISAKANFDFISKYKIYFCNVIIRILLHTVKWKRGRGRGGINAIFVYTNQYLLCDVVNITPATLISQETIS